jgi:hypothetical protein
MMDFIAQHIGAIESLAKLTLVVIGAAILWWSGRTKSAKLQASLDVAQKDILFLLAVESAHCDDKRHVVGLAGKNTMRQIVRQTTDLDWSGKNTASLIGRRQSKAEKSSIISSLQNLSKSITE